MKESRITKPLVYVAGPYTKPEPVINTNIAVNVANALLETELVTVFIPHLCLLWHAITPKEEQFWIDYDLDVLSHCDALLRIPGESRGADGEVGWCETNNVPVFNHPQEVVDWALEFLEEKV